MTYISNKNVLLSLFTIVFISNFIFASCGSCEADNNPPVETSKSSALVTAIPESGDIEGFVIASCGMCSFGLDIAGIGWKRISSFGPFGETRGDRVFP